VILEGAMGDESPASVGSWSALEQIPAVRNHRMYAYPLNPVLHPGPRVATSLEIIARLIHPEKFQGDPAI
jgi:ABC-type Fe3+-hydroxamate transport system substrate-binding protein